MERELSPKPATPFTVAANQAVYKQLPFQDTEDFEFVKRGFIATWDEPIIKTATGKKVWDFTAFDFLTEKTVPATVNPSLWRQAQLLAKHGLFQVSDRVYQVRGFDISNITFIVGDTGYIVIDPLISEEVAAAAYQLVKTHLGDKSVVAVIYTHTHLDHFGGVKGVVCESDVEAGKVQIIAPEGFMEYAVGENAIAGSAMIRRATYQIGPFLPKNPQGNTTVGLGIARSTGNTSLIAPTLDITHTGQKLTIDGIEIIFQLTPGTEAPVEMNFYFPQFKALCMAENANASIHNILTLRGALVRDAKSWAEYLTESIRLFANQTEVMFASHFWPRWGQEKITKYLKTHRDAYKYLHDQTLRLMNHGYTGIEIAEILNLPESIGKYWYNRGYYGTLNHNIKAIYQRYFGWYDANPANLHPLPPAEASQKYVEFMGGGEAILAKAQKCFEKGEYRWTAQVLNHLVFAEPSNLKARQLLADTYEQLAYQAEAGTWRNIYLMGAKELRHGLGDKEMSGSPDDPDTMKVMTPGMLFDYFAVRINGPKAAEIEIKLNFRFTDVEEEYLVTVENGALVHQANLQAEDADAKVLLTKDALVDISLGLSSIEEKRESSELHIEGDAEKFSQLFGLLDDFDFWLNLVEP
ncbi:MAG: alkyl sulfatase dimerization domain-containing protein [Oscillatoria sp. PMC 1050.18]|nr:alkyl sulfatase dimerization domain-containing protein [Oscillatoria sp. PMC 1050.18]